MLSHSKKRKSNYFPRCKWSYEHSDTFCKVLLLFSKFSRSEVLFRKWKWSSSHSNSSYFSFIQSEFSILTSRVNFFYSKLKCKFDVPCRCRKIFTLTEWNICSYRVGIHSTLEWSIRFCDFEWQYFFLYRSSEKNIVAIYPFTVRLHSEKFRVSINIFVLTNASIQLKENVNNHLTKIEQTG